MSEDQQDVKMTIVGPSQQDVHIETALGEPNIIIQFVQPFVALSIRACTTFLETLVGGLGVGATGFVPGNVWRNAVLIATSTTAVSAIKNAVTIFTELEKKYPLLKS